MRRSAFAGANLVYAGYCSSDAWVGNIAAQDATTLKNTKNVAGTNGWAFKGQRIIEATLATLSTHFGFGAMPKTRLLFGGCSAGARGAMFNLDYIGGLVPSSVQVHGFLDSPLWCAPAAHLVAGSRTEGAVCACSLACSQGGRGAAEPEHGAARGADAQRV